MHVCGRGQSQERRWGGSPRLQHRGEGGHAGKVELVSTYGFLGPSTALKTTSSPGIWKDSKRNEVTGVTEVQAEPGSVQEVEKGLEGLRESASFTASAPRRLVHRGFNLSLID